MRGGAEKLEPPRSTPPRQSRGWIWYFSVVAVLTVLATGTLIWFNYRQQLKPEQLEAARKLWKEHGPKDYDLRYSVKTRDETRIDHYTVVVRGGKVQAVTLLGERRPAVGPAPKAEAIPKEKFHYYGMPALFDQIEQFLDQDRQPDRPRVFAVARFDSQDGHLVLYRRSVSATREHQEIIVDEFKRQDGKESAKEPAPPR
jgi:hypothetical protein